MVLVRRFWRKAAIFETIRVLADSLVSMKFIGAEPTFDLTYSDVFLVPRRSDVGSRLSVDLAPNDGTPATIPLVASNMNSVTGPRLASVLARRGGLGVLPQDLDHAALRSAIRQVKEQPVLFDTPIVLSPTQTVAEALAQVPVADGQGVVIADVDPGDTLTPSRVLGVVAATRLAQALPDARLGALVQVSAPVLDIADIADPAHIAGVTNRPGLGADTAEGRALFDAVDALLTAALESGDPHAQTVIVAQGGVVRGTLTRTSALRASLYRPALDEAGRLAVAAAVGINGDTAARARGLVEAGANALVIDTAHGHQDAMLRAIESVSKLDLGLPIVAGNVVTADGVRDLVSAGATILKVGVGPGAMCTTRMMTAVGRPQFSAVLETAQAAREVGAHVWADGGVRYPRDVALALAAGSASVMIGSWFAGTAESPGALRTDEGGRQYKESWGMASTKAVQGRFEGLDAYERARKELFAEGISSSKIYLDPKRPSVEDLVDMITSGVRSACTYAGAATLAEFHAQAEVGVQSASGYEEGKALPVSW